MLGLPTTNGTWDRTEVYQAYTGVMLPMCAVCLFLNVLAVIVTYSFKKSRRFPASVLGWNALFNVYAATYQVIKWSPSSPARPYLVENIKNYPNVCGLSTFIDLSIFFSDVACNTLIALTLYFSIYKRISMDYNENAKFFWCFVAGIWAWFLLIPVVVGTSSHKIFSPFCYAGGELAYAYSIPTLLLLVLQVVMIVLSINAAFRVIKNASSLHQKLDIRRSFLIIRFGSTYFAQLIGILPYIMWQLHLLWVAGPAPFGFFNAIVVGVPLASMLDAIILISTNKSFQKWIQTRIINGKSFSDSSSEETQKKTSNNNKSTKSPSNYSVRDVELSTSAKSGMVESNFV